MTRAKFRECLAESRSKWKPGSLADRVAQVVGAASGYTTAKVIRDNYTDAAREIIDLFGESENE